MDGLGIAASLGELRGVLESGTIRSVYEPEAGLFVLHVAASPTFRVLIAPRGAAIHRTQLELPNPPTPSSFVMLLRKHLRGGRVKGITQKGWDRVVELAIERRDGRFARRYRLIAELVGVRGNLLLIEGDTVIGSSRADPRNPVGKTYQAIAHQSKIDPAAVTPRDLENVVTAADVRRALARTIDGMGRDTADDVVLRAETAGAGLLPDRVWREIRRVVEHVSEPDPHYDPVAGRAAFYPLPEPAEAVTSFSDALDRVHESLDGSEEILRGDKTLRTALLRELAKRSRTADKLRAWLGKADGLERLRREADLLMMHHREISRGVHDVTLRDPEAGEDVVVSLDPSLGAIENAQRRYTRIKRLRRGIPQVSRRLARLEHELAVIEEAIAAVDNGIPLPESAGPFLPASSTPRAPVASSDGRRYSFDGYEILVGRSAADNDRLLRVAEPDDLWMHVRGHAGSHVIVRRKTREEIPLYVQRHAAGLAGHFSKARGECRVHIAVTKVRYVRKPKGAPAGLVIIENEDTLTVAPKAPEETSRS